jgi:hypothetical protein
VRCAWDERLFVKVLYVAVLCSFSFLSYGQAGPAASTVTAGSVANKLRLLQQRLDQVELDLAKARADAETARQESSEFREQLAQLKQQLANGRPDSTASEQEQLDLLDSKLDEQYQTKVESSSKYSVRMSGMILLNGFTNRGASDNIENPTFARKATDTNPGTSFGGTIRQTELGFELFGPQLFGGRASGNLQFDFAGGYANTPNGATLGLVRLRTGTVRLDWEKTSLIAGQDNLFITPTSPTSFASMQVPAMANSGQLWGWIPQIRLDRKFAAFAHSQFLIQGGILDPISSKVPDGSQSRTVSVGEVSHRPALAARLAWSHPLFGDNVIFGFGHYRARQNWGNGGTAGINSWVNTIDWTLPVTRFFEITGAYHDGRALADLGGGLGQNVGTFLPDAMPLDVLPDGPSEVPLTAFFKGLASQGGWVQAKLKPLPKFEINFAGGQESRNAHEVELAASTQDYFDQDLARNRSYMANVVFRPRSNLIISTEYRHVRSFALGEDEESLNHFNLAVGVLF